MMEFKKRWNAIERKASEDIRLEEERASEVLSKHNSLAPPSIQDLRLESLLEGRHDCPICLDPSEFVTSRKKLLRLPCCGKDMCLKCWNQYRASRKIDYCLLCRTPPDGMSGLSHLKRNVREGRAWAQMFLAELYCPDEPDHTHPDLLVDEEARFFWMEMAAKQGHKAAYLPLVVKLVKMRRFFDARVWIEKVMPIRDPGILMALGYSYCMDPPKKLEEGVRLLTIAAKGGDVGGQFYLGQCFLEGVGVPINKEISLSTQAARQNCMCAQGSVIATLLDKAEACRNLLIPGCSVFPAVVCWYKLFVQNGGTPREFIEQMDKQMKSICGRCRKTVKEITKENRNVDKEGRENFGTSSLRKCSQCKIIHYCSRESQIQHWMAGHRKD